jgi:hypothetical protein
LVKCASKSTASEYFAALLRYSLAVGLKRLGQGGPEEGAVNESFMVLKSGR